MARLRPGEYVSTPEDIAAGRMPGGGGHSFTGDVYLDGRKVGTAVALHVTNAQERQVGFPSLRS